MVVLVMVVVPVMILVRSVVVKSMADLMAMGAVVRMVVAVASALRIQIIPF
jgi:hypothetical protein